MVSGYGQSFEDGAPQGYAITAAYQVDNAVGLVCEQCGAEVGRYCVVGGVIKRIPCMPRLGLAYRTNNPRGRQEHEERRAYLAEYRRTFQPSWQRGPVK